MPQFNVTFTYTVTVYADDERDAEDMAAEELNFLPASFVCSLGSVVEEVEA